MKEHERESMWEKKWERKEGGSVSDISSRWKEGEILDLFLGCACMRQNQALHAETGTGILQREARVLIKTSAQRLSLSLSASSYSSVSLIWLSSSLLHSNYVCYTLKIKVYSLTPFWKLHGGTFLTSQMSPFYVPTVLKDSFKVLSSIEPFLFPIMSSWNFFKFTYHNRTIFSHYLVLVMSYNK